MHIYCATYIIGACSRKAQSRPLNLLVGLLGPLGLITVGLITVPWSNLKTRADIAFAVVANRPWNSLPVEIKSANNGLS